MILEYPLARNFGTKLSVRKIIFSRFPDGGKPYTNLGQVCAIAKFTISIANGILILCCFGRKSSTYFRL